MTGTTKRILPDERRGELSNPAGREGTQRQRNTAKKEQTRTYSWVDAEQRRVAARRRARTTKPWQGQCSPRAGFATGSRRAELRGEGGRSDGGGRSSDLRSPGTGGMHLFTEDCCPQSAVALTAPHSKPELTRPRHRHTGNPNTGLRNRMQHKSSDRSPAHKHQRHRQSEPKPSSRCGRAETTTKEWAHHNPQWAGRELRAATTTLRDD